MTSYRLSTFNAAAGESPDIVMGTGQALNGDKGFIGSTCQQIKDSIMGDDFNFSARHLVTSERLDRKDIDYDNQLRNIIGYDYIWTADRPNDQELDPSSSGESHPSLGNCFQIRTNKNAKGQYALIIGDWTGHNDLERRWTCPIGIQFEWANKFTNDSSVGLSISGLYFYYMSKKLQSSQYIGLIKNGNEDAGGRRDGEFYHPDSGTSGNNLLLDLPSEVGGDDKTGKVIAFVEPEGISKIKDPNNHYYLHGIEFRIMYDGKDNSNKRKFLHFYNVKLLYDINVTNNSRVIIPQVHHRDDFFRQGGYPI